MNTYIKRPRYKLKSTVGPHKKGEVGVFFGQIGDRVMLRFYSGTERRSVYGPTVMVEEKKLRRVKA